MQFLLLRGGEHYKLLVSNFKKKNDGGFTDYDDYFKKRPVDADL
ncbi:3798_t:CDS:2, partial [Funneliformis mosseae]